MNNQGSERQPSGRRIALGLADYLAPFAERIVAETCRQFAAQSLLNWRFTFLEIADDPETTIFFNIHRVDVRLGLTCFSSGQRYTPTDWELFQIKEHEIWWPRIEWWDEETRVSNFFD